MAPKIAVIYSSTWGHNRQLAEKIAESATTAGAKVDILQFPETLPAEVLKMMHAEEKKSYPIVKADDLPKYDGFLFGIPSRFGRAGGAVSSFFDTTGSLWSSGALHGKAAGIFTSSGAQHGGQETTIMSTLPFFAHLGMAFVPIGFASKSLLDISEIVGGSAWGAATVAGHGGGEGSRSVSEKELEVAAYQGESFTKFVAALAAGRAALASTSA